MRFGRISVSNTTQVANTSLTLGSGPTSARPASPANGEMRYNTTNANAELYMNNAWVPFVPGKRPVFGTIPAQSGSANITLGNSAPTSTSGAQIMSTTFTPSYTSSAIEFRAQFIIDVSQTTIGVIMAFRNTTLIGMQIVNINLLATLILNNSNFPSFVNMEVFDQPASKEAQTYSLRFATAGGNWTVNRTISYSMGNGAVFSGNYSIREHI